MVQILSRRKKNNPILIGEAGVGKSAIVEGLALRIARGEVPYTIADKTLFSLDAQGKENYKAYKEEQAEKARQRELSRLEHGQRLECKKDIEALIAEKFNGFVLPRNTADEIIDKYGIDCVEFVLANTVTHFDYDGRFSQNNKEWAKGIVAENEWENNDLILSSHPAVLDGFTNQARRYINVIREKEKEAQQKITIDGYECVLVDELLPFVTAIVARV